MKITNAKKIDKEAIDYALFEMLAEYKRCGIKKGDILGSVTYSYKGTQISTANLVATNDVQRNEILHVINLIIKVIISLYYQI